MVGALLEREPVLAELREAARGGVVLLGGEAGVGKSTVARRLADEADGPALVGWCDPLDTPRALGPLLDFAADLAPDLPGRIAAGDDPTAVFGHVLALLSTVDAPRLVVVEDLHWADQATLDLVRFLARRAQRLRALVLGTFRDEGIPAGGPLAVLLGDLATAPGVRRLDLRPLSREATAALARESEVDGDALFERTGGNPFFITEVLAAGTVAVPLTVRDAVLARLSRLAPETRDAVQAAAVLGARCDPVVLGALLDVLDAPRWTMRDAVLAGVLRWDGPVLAFRHELVAAAVSDATAPKLRHRLHAAALDLLAADATPGTAAELVRHAEGAGDDAAVLRWAPVAAEWAAGRGAHREAAALYAMVVRRSRGEPSLLEELAEQRYLGGDLPGAVVDHQRASHQYRQIGDALGAGRNLVRVSWLSSLLGDYAAFTRAAEDADECLAKLPPSRELAMAYESQSRYWFMALDGDAARDWGRRALDTLAGAGVPDTTEVGLNARVTVAAAGLNGGDLTRIPELRELLAAARAAGLTDLIARTTLYLGLLPVLQRHYEGVDEYFADGLAYAREHGLEYYQALLTAARIRADLERGRWARLEADARPVLERADAVPVARLNTLVAVGRLRARRGQPDDEGWLALAATLADRYDRVEGLVQSWPARAEAAWLAGETGEVARIVETALGHGAGARNPWWLGELAYWRHRAGFPAETVDVAEPYRLAIAGDWAAAGRWWEERGCPYDAAVARTAADDPAVVAEAVDALDRLGARPAAAQGRAHLRRLGVTATGRGPRPDTAANPAGLTNREREIVELLAAGLTNPQIAARLFLSAKTVERHVTAVLRKLSASTRAEAVAAARAAGVLE